MQASFPQQCEAEELQSMLQSSDAPCLIDVREKWEVDICQLPGAIHIPLGQLPNRLDDLPRDRDIVVYCHHGVRSLQASSMIRMAGFSRSTSLRGGIDAWANRIDVNIKKY